MFAIASRILEVRSTTKTAERPRLKTRLLGRLLPASISLVMLPQVSHAYDYYVSTKGSDSNSGTSSSSPFLNFWRAQQVVHAGDTIHVAAGMYTTGMYITASGSSGKPITIMGDSASLPQISLKSGYPIQFAPYVSWVNVKYFNVTTANESGIWAGQKNHHLVIANNIVRDCYGSGIGAWQSDYMTISNNTVYNNAFWSPQDGSGINLLQSYNYDTSTATHNYIQGNIVYNNANKIPLSGHSYTTDGNGIIIDDLRHANNSSLGPAYTGSTVIQNNLVYDNGGRGIHVYSSDNVTIRNNTTWHNNWDPQNDDYHAGEIETYAAGNIQVFNNIMVSAGGGLSKGAPAKHVAFSASNTSGKALTADYNLTYGGSSTYYFTSSSLQTWGSHNKTSDPLFTYANSNPVVANFKVAPNSPALGLSYTSQAPPTDILGVTRASPVTDGAYENPY